MHTNEKRRAEADHTSIQLVLTNDVSPRESQDKTFPKYSKFNPKLKSFL